MRRSARDRALRATECPLGAYDAQRTSALNAQSHFEIATKVHNSASAIPIAAPQCGLPKENGTGTHACDRPAAWPITVVKCELESVRMRTQSSQTWRFTVGACANAEQNCQHFTTATTHSSKIAQTGDSHRALTELDIEATPRTLRTIFHL